MLGVFLIVALMQLIFFSKQHERVSSQIGSEAVAWLVAKERLEESLALAEPSRKKESIEEPGLHFTFDNGIDIDPNFCGRCRARLWKNSQGLFLTLYGQNHERTQEIWRGEGAISFALSDGKQSKYVESAHIDRSLRAVVIELGDTELICSLHAAQIQEAL